LAKKAAEFGGEAASQAKRAAESVSKQAMDFSETNAFKKVSEVSEHSFILYQRSFYVNWLVLLGINISFFNFEVSEMIFS
jgi:hypothetical protein